MPKVTLDMNTFKALASDSRLDILRSLDGKKMSLNDISRVTKLNKATLHEHLAKLNQAGLVKKYEREGHKWVYYKLTWKGEGLLHPENTRIVVMFSITFVSLLIGVMLFVNFAQPITVGMAETYGDTTYIYEVEDEGIPLFTHSYSYNLVESVTAINQSVNNITFALYENTRIDNSLGQKYNPKDIQWQTTSNRGIKSDQLILESWNFTSDYYKDLMNQSEGKNKTDNDTENRTIALDGYEEFFGYYPVVPEMIATVQDSTLLYLATFCITFFGVLFTLSSWRFLKSRKPSL